MSKMSSVAVSVSMPADIVERARLVAEKQGRPFSWVVRDAIVKYMNELEGTTTGSSGTSGEPVEAVEESGGGERDESE